MALGVRCVERRLLEVWKLCLNKDIWSYRVIKIDRLIGYFRTEEHGWFIRYLLGTINYTLCKSTIISLIDTLIGSEAHTTESSRLTTLDLWWIEVLIISPIEHRDAVSRITFVHVVFYIHDEFRWPVNLLITYWPTTTCTLWNAIHTCETTSIWIPRAQKH